VAAENAWILGGRGRSVPLAVAAGVALLALAPGAAVPAAALLGLDAATLRTVELGLLAGTPGLAAIGLIIAALTVGMRSGAALAGLLLIPLAVPLLVFGAGALATGGDGGIALTGAISLLLVAIAPFAGGAAIRAAREG
jgi:heme exporter protein B